MSACEARRGSACAASEMAPALLAVVAAALPLVCAAYQLAVEDFKVHCYGERFSPHTAVRVEFLVVQGSGDAPPVDLVVKDAGGKVVFNQSAANHTVWTTTAPHDGEPLWVCFNQVDRVKKKGLKILQQGQTPPRKIFVDIGDANSRTDYPSFARDDDLVAVQRQLAAAHSKVDMVVKQIRRSAATADRLEVTEQTIAGAVPAVGVVTSVVIIVGGLLQTYQTARKLKEQKLL